MAAQVMLRLVRLLACGALLAALPLGAQPLADAPPGGPVLRNEDLVAYLVGSWRLEADDEDSRTIATYRYGADGRFEGEIRVLVRQDRSRDAWALAAVIKASGTWSIEDDVLTETTQRLSIPGALLPTVERTRLRALPGGGLEAVDLASGKRHQSQRQFAGTARHAQAFRAAWPEPATEPSAWETYAQGDDGEEAVDTTSLRRDGELVSGWTRSTMSAAALQAAQQQAEAVAKAGGRPQLIDRGLSYLLVDCTQAVYKYREMRIYDGAVQVSGTKFEDADPLEWERIGRWDRSLDAFRRRVCAAP